MVNDEAHASTKPAGSCSPPTQQSRNSTSLDPDERPSNTSQPTRRTKIRYNRRNAMAHDHASPHQHTYRPRSRPKLSSGTPHDPALASSLSGQEVDIPKTRWS